MNRAIALGERVFTPQHRLIIGYAANENKYIIDVYVTGLPLRITHLNTQLYHEIVVNKYIYNQTLGRAIACSDCEHRLNLCSLLNPNWLLHLEFHRFVVARFFFCVLFYHRS